VTLFGETPDETNKADFFTKSAFALFTSFYLSNGATRSDFYTPRTQSTRASLLSWDQ
jgi:hypothetical protein